MPRIEDVFPPYPTGIKGRSQELTELASLATPGQTVRVALVGPGGSGKSTLACALGYRVRPRFPGGLHWFRSGPWDVVTLTEMLAIRFGTATTRHRRLAALRRALAARGSSLIVLDNHENDQAIAALLSDLAPAPVTWVITARRCLLTGVHVFPVVAPRAPDGAGAFARVRSLTTLLRYSPLALDIADALIRSGAVTVQALRSWLVEQGVDRVRVGAHEDDLPEVTLLVDWAWRRLSRGARRMLAVLAHTGGDHVDEDSLAVLAGVRTAADRAAALRPLRRWRLVQSPLPGRYALHAVVRYALVGRTEVAPSRFAQHYLALLEREPERLDLEQTHLYAAMDHAHRESDMPGMLRIERLLAQLADGSR